MSLEHAHERGESSFASGPAAYTVSEFCAAHRISRTQLYKMWKEGRGPRYMMNGVRRIITAEASADFRRDGEAQARAAGEAA